jgi:hypothetical protein
MRYAQSHDSVWMRRTATQQAKPQRKVDQPRAGEASHARADVFATVRSVVVEIEAVQGSRES